MPRQRTQAEAEQFLAEPRVGVLSVASDDGRPPLTAPIWYGYQPGGEITFFTGTQGRTARKTRLLRKAGVLSFSVQHPEFPYRYVTAECRVVRVDQPPHADQMLPIAGRYLPPEAAEHFVAGELTDPGPGLTLFTVRPERWFG